MYENAGRAPTFRLRKIAILSPKINAFHIKKALRIHQPKMNVNLIPFQAFVNLGKGQIKANERQLYDVGKLAEGV